MMTATTEYLSRIEALSEARIQEIRSLPDKLIIRGTAYYVSCDGDDTNDGRTPDTAWKTLARVSSAALMEGDGVLFRRGDLFRGKVITSAGVSYGAYGEGDKPKFYGWDRSLDDPALWTLTDAEHHIWKWEEKILDPGTLVFNHGEAHSVKLIPSYIEGRFVCRNDESKLFDMKEEMVRDLDIYWHFEDTLTTVPSKGQDFPIPVVNEESLGDLYLRCDKGNPAEVFHSIEAATKRPMFVVGARPNVRIDNLCR